jgi:glycine C-acetyltransferase/8-amino-7-oxononanoate synthase
MLPSDLDRCLEEQLAALDQAGLRRRLRRIDSPPATRIQVEGHWRLNFSANDYLGLAAHPALREAARAALERYGPGSGASRLICGSLAPHHELETALAQFKGTDAALAFSSGYATAVGVVPALVGAGDVVVLDKRVHACLIDGARLSGARLRVFPHGNLERLQDILRWADCRAPAPSAGRRPRTLVLTESVFSMDGDQAPLRDLVALKERYGAWLLVDEAHATGLYGPQRRGLAEALGVADRVEVQMGTLGKALGTAGGYISGSRPLVDYLVNRARSFIFSTAPPPPTSAAATAALGLVASDLGRELCDRLWANVTAVARGLAATSAAANSPVPPSAIIPLVIGGERDATELSAALLARGVFIPAVRFPTVPRGAARLRLTVTAAHTPGDLAQLLAAWRNVREPRNEPRA